MSAAAAIEGSSLPAGAVPDGDVVGIGPGGLPIMATCSTCGEKGHNSRTCGVKADKATPSKKGSTPVKRRRQAATTSSRPKAHEPRGPVLAIEAAIASLREELAALEAAAKILRRRSA